MAAWAKADDEMWVVAAGHRWSVKPHALPFVLGDRLVGEIERLAAFLETPVDQITSTLSETAAALAEMPARVQALVIPSHPLNAPDQLRLSDAIVSIRSRHPHHLIDLKQGAAAYRAGLCRKHRHELGRKARRFEAAAGGAAAFRYAREADEIARFLDQAGPLAASTYQARRLRRQLDATPAFRRWALAEAEAGRVRGALLEVDGRAVAFGWVESDGARATYQHTGYDPAFAPLSPGVILLDRLLDSLFAEARFDLLDLGYGEAQYKRAFATRSIECVTLHVHRATIANRAVLAAKAATDGLSRTAVDLAHRVGLKHRLKRRLRGQPASAASLLVR